MSAAAVVNTPAEQFGRAWSLTINTVPDETGTQQQVTAFYNTPTSPGWTPEGLHIEFEVTQSVTSWLWHADISVYNLNNPTEQLVITQGMTVSLSAGYAAQPYGVIFEGTVFQPTWERLNVTDFKLTLHCVVGFVDLGNNFAAQSFAKGLTQRQLVARMAAGASNPLYPTPINTPITLSTNPAADTALGQNTLSRGGILFNSPEKYFEQASKYNGLNTWASNAQQNILSIRQANTNVPTVSFGVGNGLLGTPQQTQWGVDCRVLLDPRITPATQIYLDQGALTVAQNTNTIGNANTYPTILSQSGYYAVLAVRHVGDSRSNTWETQITGSLYTADLLAALQAFPT